MKSVDPKFIGEHGEQIAKEYLIKKGYSILKENWRYSRSEIDLIAENENFIVFVEVKSRNTKYYGSFLNTLSESKVQSINRAIIGYYEIYTPDKEIRTDLIGILETNGKYDISHYEHVI